MYRRLHLIANNTRFVVLAERAVFANLASWMMSAMLGRLSDDWQGQYGHPLLVVESFVDPAQFAGTMYAAANWTCVGNSKPLCPVQRTLQRPARQAEAALRMQVAARRAAHPAS